MSNTSASLLPAASNVDVLVSHKNQNTVRESNSKHELQKIPKAIAKFWNSFTTKVKSFGRKEKTTIVLNVTPSLYVPSGFGMHPPFSEFLSTPLIRVVA